MTFAPQPADSAISCVIPTHRRADYLRQALSSAIGQTRAPAEIVVVGDVIDDAARAVVTELAATAPMPVQYVEHTVTTGASSSRNEGARRATSPVLAFLDDDDWWDDRYLAHAAEALTASGAPLVVTWITMVMGERYIDGPAIREGLAAAEVVARNPGATGSNIVVRAADFEAVGGFDLDLRMRNDTDFIYRFLAAGNSYTVVPERFVKQRKHGSGQLTGHSDARALAVEQYLRKHRAVLSWSDRRYHRFLVHRMRSHTAGSPVARLAHKFGALANYSWRQFRADRRARGHSSFYRVPGVD